MTHLILYSFLEQYLENVNKLFAELISISQIIQLKSVFLQDARIAKNKNIRIRLSTRR